MNKTYLLKNRWLLTKIAVAGSLAIALGRKLLKGNQHPKRSTKPADGITTAAFDLACSKGITFRAARQELQSSVKERVREANTTCQRATARLIPAKSAHEPSRFPNVLQRCYR